MEKFKVEIKLVPDERGLEELRAWPNTSFTPDIIVVVGGYVRIQIGGKFVYTDKTGTIQTSTEAHYDAYWWPDYALGFARNLADAALKMHQSGFKHGQAAFIDEPAVLTFKAVAANQIEVAFRFESHVYVSETLPPATITTQIKATLQRVLDQLLTINPSLKGQPEVSYLASAIQRL